MNKCKRCYKINAGVHTCTPQMLTIQEFREKCWTEWDFEFLWWEISNLPNWEWDWKTCVAWKWNTRIRDTEELVYNHIKTNYENKNRLS